MAEYEAHIESLAFDDDDMDVRMDRSSVELKFISSSDTQFDKQLIFVDTDNKPIENLSVKTVSADIELDKEITESDGSAELSVDITGTEVRVADDAHLAYGRQTF